ncbi:MAG: response regulator [Cytophagaceae bacterium]
MKKLGMILLVDDDPINNFINERLLKKCGIAEKVQVTHNGQEALDIIQQQLNSDKASCPEFIILDNHMPVMDGIKFLEHFNRLNIINRDEVIILALLASSSEADVQKFRSLGVDEISYKPLSEDMLEEICLRYWALPMR